MPKTEFTFDDILLLPGKSPYEIPGESNIDLSAKLTKKLTLKIPIVSANMSTITESEMAISLARRGGIGVIHSYMPEARQLSEVRQVKSENLPVGAAVVCSGPAVYMHIQNLVQSGCDVVFIDSANAHNREVINLIAGVKKKFQVQVVAGNVVTASAVTELIKAGADAVKVGIGPGSHCTTRLVTGFGRPQLSTIKECSAVAQKHGVPVIADGGISTSGDIVKALALGANTVMLGGLLAGTRETPGKIVSRDGKIYKHTWGNCTYEAQSWFTADVRFLRRLKNFLISAIKNRRFNPPDDYLEEGTDGFVEYQGEVGRVLDKMTGGIRRGLWYGGAQDIAQLQKSVKYVFVSSSSPREAGARLMQIDD